MADIFSREKRSDVMSRIRSAGNKRTELKLIVLMRKHRIVGWRRGSTVMGRPDFVFPGRRLAVFVDGCFWHGCPIHHKTPKQNGEFWSKKIARNRARDCLVTRTLRARGWYVLRIWEHDLKPSRVKYTLTKVKRALGNQGGVS